MRQTRPIPIPGEIMLGGRDAGGGKIWGGGVFAAHLACWEEFFLDGKTWPGFLFPVLVGIGRGESLKNSVSLVTLVLRRM